MRAWTVEEKLRLRRCVAAWSDQHQREATDFLREFTGLIPKKIGNAQFAGLNNLAQAAQNMNTVRDFINHQGRKAERAGSDEKYSFWIKLKGQLEKLPKEAEDVAGRAQIALPPDAKNKGLMIDKIARVLLQEWVQHLVAESILLSGG